mgnify:CR=1 FL=1
MTLLNLPQLTVTQFINYHPIIRKVLITLKYKIAIVNSIKKSYWRDFTPLKITIIFMKHIVSENIQWHLYLLGSVEIRYHSLLEPCHINGLIRSITGPS